MKPYYITITPFFPTPYYSREFFVFEQVKVIQELGNRQVVVFMPKLWNSVEKDYEYEGVKVYRFRTFALPSNILPGLFDFFSIRSLKQKLKAIDIKLTEIDVVHSHVTGLGIFANALKNENPLIKTILQHHGFDVLSLENGVLRSVVWHRDLVKKYGVKICNTIDVHIGVSIKTLNYVKSYSQITLKDSYVLYNGINFEKFYKIPDSKNLKYFTIGCIGSFWPLKDQVTLLKATKILVADGMTAIRVKMIGTGETLAMCKQYVSDNKLEDYVEFTDKLPHYQLVHFYNTLNLFVLPSYYEAFGCVYTEAYACGVPFIAVEDQGIAELIPEKDHSKWLIKKGDFKGLAEKIEAFRVNQYQQDLTESIDLKDTVTAFLKYILK